MATLTQKIDHKRAMKEFYKNVHPDTIQTAPKRVKEENLRSLSVLNDYIDKVRKNEGSPSLKVRFYAPEKDNSKSKRYYYFEAYLDSFSPNSDPEFVDILEKRTITKLVSNLKATQYYNNPCQDKTSKQEYSKDITQSAEIHIANNPELLAKSSSKREIYTDLAKFRQGIVNYENNKQKQEIMKNIQKNLYVFFDDLPYKDYYSEEIFKDLTFNVIEKKLKEYEIELKLFYVAGNLEPHEVFGFFKKFSKALRNQDYKKTYYHIQNRLISEDPRIKLLLGDTFKVAHGFIFIDINGDPDKILEYIQENIETALEERDVSISSENLLTKEIENVLNSFKLSSIDFSNYDTESHNDREISYTKKIIFLKKIVKLGRMTGSQFDGYNIILALENKINTQTKSLYLKWNFNELDISGLLTQTSASN